MKKGVDTSHNVVLSLDHQNNVTQRKQNGGKNMTIFKENKETGLMCGVNEYGELFLGDNQSGYNLPDTPENREYILADFERYNK